MKRLIVFLIIVVFSSAAYADNVCQCESEIQKVVEIKNEQGELSQCFIVEETANCHLWGGIAGYDAKDFWADFTILMERDIEQANLYINSGGGAVFAGMSIADTIRMARADGLKVNTFASGLVASAAVPVFLAGETRTASKNATFMIHKGKLFKMFASETIDDLDAQREMMKLTEKQYVDFIVEKTDLCREDVVDKMDKTTWFGAEQAVEWGFADKIK